ncbi:sugar ABC transporter substrate-binding protein [Allobaculum stercoricanis]|uniref:sugar ABC transporter substrate-binding protein n=1 Tax=Allobaculum stercoricanis TaxID=174709 RepID=UPI0012EAD76B|nr:sugar ABC transporter substrate-binding protein [Allobaculum stercoricanis]
MKNKNDGFWTILCCVTLFCGCILYDFYNRPNNTQARVIGVSSMTLNNPFFEVINNELKKETEQKGDQLMILDPMLSSNRQEEQIETMIENKVDAIILNPVNSATLEDALKKAKDARIPVVVVDSSIQHEELIETTIVSKNYEAGAMCAQAMMEDLDRGEILLLEHAQADSGRERIKGFLDAIKDHPEYKVVAREECEGQLEQAMPKAAEVLSDHPEIDIIMCLNDPSALGAAAAAESLNRKDLYIYGVDGTPDFKSRMTSDPNLKATVAQSPYTMAKNAIKSAYDLIAGKDVDSLQLVDVKLIRKENLDDYSLEAWQ